MSKIVIDNGTTNFVLSEQAVLRFNAPEVIHAKNDFITSGNSIVGYLDDFSDRLNDMSRKMRLMTEHLKSIRERAEKGE